VSETDKIVKNIEELTSRAVGRVQRSAEIPPRLLDIQDSGRYLGMSDKAVRELIAEGQLPYIQRVPGRSPYLIDVRDLNCWIERSKIRAPAKLMKDA
jgi:hypothetical protein